MILYDYKSGLTQHESIDRLHAAFGDHAPSRTTVFEWFGEFRRGRRSLDDAPRWGRPAEVTTEDKVAAVHAMVEEDARMTAAQLARLTGMSAGSVVTILHEKLGLSKVCARWIPHRLNEEHVTRAAFWSLPYVNDV